MTTMNLFGYVSGNLGYNVHLRGFARGLISNGIDLRLVPFDERLKSAIEAELMEAIRKKPKVDAPSICLAYADDTMRFHGKKRIAYTVWETTRIPPHWPEFLNACDEVWTVSKFCKKSFEDSGVKVPINIVHEGVDDTVFNPFVQKLQWKNDRFVFLFIGKWEKRKGIELLIEAYSETFKPDENVALALQPYNPFLENFNPFLLMHEMNLPKRAPIIVLPPTPTQAELAKYYAGADCFVLPTRGESCGLPLLEAMACGIPVITTNWGGSLDYVNENVGWLIDVEKTETPDDGLFFKPYPDNEWAVPSKAHLCELLRYAFEHRDECRKKGKEAYKHVSEKFTLEAVTKDVPKLLEA